MTDSTRSAVFGKAKTRIEEVQIRLEEISGYLTKQDLLPALGAIAGLAELVQQVENHLTILRDLESYEPKPGDS